MLQAALTQRRRRCATLTRAHLKPDHKHQSHIIMQWYAADIISPVQASLGTP